MACVPGPAAMKWCKYVFGFRLLGGTVAVADAFKGPGFGVCMSMLLGEVASAGPGAGLGASDGPLGTSLLGSVCGSWCGSVRVWGGWLS